MEQPATHTTQLTRLQSLPDRRDRPAPANQPDGDNPLQIEHLQPPAGEAICHFAQDHTLFLSQAPRPVLMFHRMEGKTYSGFSGRGDMAIAPANTSLFARWDRDDDYLQIRLSAAFVKQVAEETLERDGDRLELMPQFQARNPQLEAIGQMIATEAQHRQAQGQNRLYLDSLAHILAVNLLRDYSTTATPIPVYDGGLPPHQLRRVLDYIEAHLSQDIKLADVAQQLDLSPFHFSRLFKQSIGLSPHQYLLQQRVEKAKGLLQRTDRRIIDIALECGFSSHSHLSKLFRQFTGITPKAFRAG